MKKILSLFVLLAITGMAAAQAEDVFKLNGLIYEQSSTPFSGYFDGNIKPLKTGEARCTNYFHIVTKGDCSIQKAMEDNGIKKLSSIDKVTKNILGYQKVTLLVHGE